MQTPKNRGKLVAEAKDAEEAYNLNPRDGQNAKRWVEALRHMVGISPGHRANDVALLYGAKLKLEKVLQSEMNYKIMFELGNMCCYILQYDRSLCRYGELYKNLLDQGIEYFKKVQREEPAVYEKCGMLETLELLQAGSKLESYEEDLEEDATLDGDSQEIFRYKQYRKEAEADYNRDPTNPKADDLFRWGSALMGIAFYTGGEPTKKYEMIKEAIEKFDKASSLVPENIYVRLELAKARLKLCRYESGDCSPLEDECMQLKKEVLEDIKKQDRDPPE